MACSGMTTNITRRSLHKYDSFVLLVDRMTEIALTDEKRDILPKTCSLTCSVFKQALQHVFRKRKAHHPEMQKQPGQCGAGQVRKKKQRYAEKEKTISISAKLQVSTNFFAWLFRFGPDIKIISPCDTAEEYRKYIKKCSASTNKVGTVRLWDTIIKEN